MALLPAHWYIRTPLQLPPLSVLHTKSLSLDVINLDRSLWSHSHFSA